MGQKQQSSTPVLKLITSANTPILQLKKGHTRHHPSRYETGIHQSDSGFKYRGALGILSPEPRTLNSIVPRYNRHRYGNPIYHA